MPMYSFRDKKTKVVEELFMWSSEYDDYLRDNPDKERVLGNNAPTVGDPMRMGRQKADPRFREHLREMKKYYGPESTIRE